VKVHFVEMYTEGKMKDLLVNSFILFLYLEEYCNLDIQRQTQDLMK